MHTVGAKSKSLEEGASLEASLVAQTVKSLPAMWETMFNPWVGKIPWGRPWQPTPVFLPGESHGQRSLEGSSLWDHKESDMTEWLKYTTVEPCSTPWFFFFPYPSQLGNCLHLPGIWPLFTTCLVTALHYLSFGLLKQPSPCFHQCPPTTFT